LNLFHSLCILCKHCCHIHCGLCLLLHSSCIGDCLYANIMVNLGLCQCYSQFALVPMLQLVKLISENSDCWTCPTFNCVQQWCTLSTSLLVINIGRHIQTLG
jgi:hypothetical protein